MSSTTEIMDNYYICLAEVSATSLPTSDAENKFDNDKVEIISISNEGKKLFPSESSIEKTFDGFLSPSLAEVPATSSLNYDAENKIDHDKVEFNPNSIEGNNFFQSESTTEKSFDGFSSHSNEFSPVKVNTHSDVSFAIIMEKLDELQTSLNTEKEKNIILKNQFKKLETKIKYDFLNIDQDIDYLYEGLNNVDFKTMELDQYIRRESLVISGIPQSITQNELENTVFCCINYFKTNWSTQCFLLRSNSVS